MRYALLLRGVNVGGKNTIAMSDLKVCLEKLGLQDVSTLLNSGNAVFMAKMQDTRQLAQQIEAALVETFQFDSERIRALVLSKDELTAAIKSAPKEFGRDPELYHRDTIFLIEGSVADIIDEFVGNPVVDTVWAGEGVIFFQRLSSKRIKSHLSKIISKPIYQYMTIRTWRTVLKLYARMSE